MEFNILDAGRFRANPNASQYNSVRIVDHLTPGTIEEDTATVDTTGALAFTGMDYTGKDGVTTYYRFFNEEIPGAARIEKDIQVAEGRAALQAAIATIVEKHEVNPIITVGGTAADFDVLHVGAGTIDNLYLDGAAEAFSRGAVTIAVAEVAE